MRAIKFRGWMEDCDGNGNGKMFAHNELTLSELIEENNRGNSAGRFALMQFTGLLDKSGKEIYEGDVVESAANALCAKFEQVYYDEGAAGYYPFSAPALGGYEWDRANPSDTRIVGNIHENPELLENKPVVE